MNTFTLQDSKTLSWENEGSPEREPTPPMPTIPPPPPPVIEDDLPEVWPDDIPDLESLEISDEEEQPYAVALFDYFTDHQEDLCFSVSRFILDVIRYF